MPDGSAGQRLIQLGPWYQYVLESALKLASHHRVKFWSLALVENPKAFSFSNYAYNKKFASESYINNSISHHLANNLNVSSFK